MRTGGLIYGTIRFTLAVPMPRKSPKNVGLIGLGIIGSRVAVALRDAGYNVFVWSRTPRAEPNFLGSPAEIAEVADIIHVFVSDATAVYEVIELFEDKLTPRHIIVCNATIGPDATIEAARRIAETGARFVDAPFTGSRDAAGAGELVYYLGGEDDVLDAVEPILKASSKALVRVGHVGQAATVKIATNMLVAVSTQALAESIAVMNSARVNSVVLEEALKHHAVHSKLIDMKLPTMLRGDFEPHFSLRNLSKDVQLALALAKSGEIELPACSATAGVLHKGLYRGWGDLDFSALIKAYEAEPASMPELTPPEKREAENEIGKVPETISREPGSESPPSNESPLIEAIVEKPVSEAVEAKPEEIEPRVESSCNTESDEPTVNAAANPGDWRDETSDAMLAPPEPLSATPPHGDRLTNEPAVPVREAGNEKEVTLPAVAVSSDKDRETPKTDKSNLDTGEKTPPAASPGIEKGAVRATSGRGGLLRRLFR